MSAAGRALVTRRLAAIVIADVVGYTRLMERDDTGTFARLRTIRDEVVDPAIVSRGGRIVKTAGDGLLAEFPSALAALRASVQIQREMATRNTGIAAADRLDYRIGVNLGDVMVDTNDIAGDGVNVASRLESLAEPGGICVSGAVREQVHGQVTVSFVDIGEQRVKNIDRPIRVYRVLDATLAAPGTSARIHWWRVGTRKSWLIGLSLLVGMGIVASVLVPKWTGDPTATRPPLSIAIMPFAAADGDAGTQALADELTQQVTMALGRTLREGRVTAYGLAAGFKGKGSDPRVVGRELSVRYLAEGEVRRADARVTVDLRLIDATSTAQVSSRRFEYTKPELLAGRDALVARLSLFLAGRMWGAEEVRVRTSGGNSPTELLLRGDAVWEATNISLAGARKARELYDEALRRDPNYVPALVRRFWTLYTELQDDLQADRDRLIAEMDAATSRAVGLDPADAQAWNARVHTLAFQGRWGEALESNTLSQRVDPDNPRHLSSRAWLMALSGQPADAVALAESAAAWRGTPSGLDLYIICQGQLMQGHYPDAIAACERAAAVDLWWRSQELLVAAYAMNGETEKAATAKVQLLKAQPDYSIALWRRQRLSDHPDFLRLHEEHFVPGLRKAGIPEK